MTFDKGVSFDLEFKYTPGERAEWDYPGSGPEIEIQKVLLNGVEIPMQAISEDMYEDMIQFIASNYE